MEMRTIIIGGGKVGSAIAKQLVIEGHDIVVVDIRKDVTDHIADNMDVMTLCGNGAAPDVLREAGVEEADIVIACTAEDELNTLCCAFAKKLGCKNTIARVRSPEYANQIYDFKEEFGLSMTINPELCAAEEIFSLLEIPGVLERESFTESGVDIASVTCKEGGPLDGIRLSDIPRKLGMHVLICTVKRGERVIIPDGKFVLAGGDRLYICAPIRKLVKMLNKLGESTRSSKNIMIIGASRMADYLTAELLLTGAEVKVIERDSARADDFAAKYPNAVVVCADGTSEEVLAAEHLKDMDAAVMLTDFDEEGLILSMYARMLGVPQVIVKVGHTNFGKLFKNSETIKVVNPQRLCADLIVSYVRAIQNSSGSPVKALRYIADNNVCAMEFKISEQCKGAGEELKNLSIMQGVLIGSIVREGKAIVPGGSEKLMPGDTAIVVAAAENRILDINDIFLQ